MIRAAHQSLRDKLGFPVGLIATNRLSPKRKWLQPKWVGILAVAGIGIVVGVKISSSFSALPKSNRRAKHWVKRTIPLEHAKAGTPSALNNSVQGAKEPPGLAEPGSPESLLAGPGSSERIVSSIQPAHPQAVSPNEGAQLPHQSTWRVFTVHAGDTLGGIFKRADIPAQTWMQILKLDAHTKTLSQLMPGQRLRLETNEKGKLLELSYPVDDVHTLKVSRIDDPSHWQVDWVKAPVTHHLHRVSGVVRHSFYMAARQAGLSSHGVYQFAQIFHWKINFRRNIHPGARFTVVYSQRQSKGHDIGYARIVAAKLVTHRRTLRAFWFVPKGGQGGYYDVDGHSLQAGILRAPVHYQFISSKFSLHRLDPFTHRWQPHYGVDYAADIGTPVEAAANGRIIYRSREHGYGRLIVIKSFGRWRTYYAHLHRYARHMHVGSHVHQGEIIGYVGQSGWATGPHLHFGIRRGRHWVNPLKAHLPEARSVPKRYLALFHRTVAVLAARLKPNRAPTAVADHNSKLADSPAS